MIMRSVLGVIWDGDCGENDDEGDDDDGCGGVDDDNDDDAYYESIGNRNGHISFARSTIVCCSCLKIFLHRLCITYLLHVCWVNNIRVMFNCHLICIRSSRTIIMAIHNEICLEQQCFQCQDNLTLFYTVFNTLLYELCVYIWCVY